jgi:Flp pilus assembly pilin Flp
MFDLIRKLVREDRGQDLAEYAMALAVITIGAALIAASIGSDVETLWSNAQEAIDVAVTAEA